MKPLVSVIIPVYKVEDCLTRCLDSICSQSLKDIEILLIDDASPDRSGEICEAYAAKDSRIIVFHNKTNQGLSVARNIGIANASSDYLMFVDSDDLVHEDFCKDTYECAVYYHADLVLFRYKRIRKSAYFESNNSSANKSLKSGYKTRLEAMDLLYNHKDVQQAVWNKLYRKELFRNIAYPPGYFYEDVGTTYKIVWWASCIYFLDEILYYHYYRAGSITTLKTEKLLRDRAEMFIQQYNDLLAWGFSPDKLNSFSAKHALWYCIRKKPDDADEYYRFCENVLHNSKSIPVYLTWKMKVIFVLFKYCKPLFEMICISFDKKVN